MTKSAGKTFNEEIRNGKLHFLRSVPPARPPADFKTKPIYMIVALISKILRKAKYMKEVRNGEMSSISISARNNYTKSSKETRAEFCNYFNTTGTAPWQEKFI